MPFILWTWIEIQPDCEQFTFLDFPSKLNIKQYFSEFESAINYITVTKGAYAILDPHNYMRYNDPSQQPMTGSVIGNTSDVKAATTAQFAKFWGELARRFKKNEKVIFGLMNEVRPQDPKIKPN